MKLVRLLANLGSGSRKEVQRAIRGGTVTDLDGRVLGESEVPPHDRIRYRGEPHAYLNRCTHVPMEMDYQANRLVEARDALLQVLKDAPQYLPAELLAGTVLCNTAVHQPAGSPAPALIRAARTRGVLRRTRRDGARASPSGTLSEGAGAARMRSSRQRRRKPRGKQRSRQPTKRNCSRTRP